MMQFRRALILVAAAFLTSCGYEAPPTAPTILPSVVVVDSPPPALPSPTPVELVLAVTREEIYAGEGLSLRAVPIKGQLFAPAVYAWTFGDGETATTETAFAGHVYAARGEYPASVHVRDRDGTQATASTVVTVTRRPSPPKDPPPPPPGPPCPTITLAPSTLPSGTVGTPYNQTLTAAGGQAPYRFTTADTLPAGLVLGSTGVVSGSPTTPETATFIVDARDADGCRGARSYTVTITDAPTPPPPPPPPPTLTASLSCTADATLTVSCNISGTYDGQPVPSADIDEVDWDWGDGSSGPSAPDPESPAQTHLYTQPGTWTVIATMTATTTDGVRTATASRVVTVPAP